MKVAGVISMVSWLSCTFSGILLAGGLQTCQTPVKRLHPPFENERYQCRCFPVSWEVRVQSAQDASLHPKICEYKTYITSLKRHIDFLMALCAGQPADVAAWFVDHGRALDTEVVGYINKALGSRDQRLTPQARRELSMVLKYFQTRKSTDVGGVNNEERLSTNEQIYQRHVKQFIEKHRKLIPASKRCFSIIGVANWFWDKARELLKINVKSFFTQTTGELLNDFPWADVEKNMRTATMKKIVHNMGTGFSVTAFNECWKALSTINFEESEDLFDTFFAGDLSNTTLISQVVTGDMTEKRIMYAFLLLKDFSDLTTLLMHQVVETLACGVGDKKMLTDEQLMVLKAVSLEQLVGIYEKLNQLPIAGTIDVLNTFAQQCVAVIQILQQDKPVDFTAWLKNNWLAFPLIIGVIVVKIAQYYGVTSVGQDAKFVV